MKKEKPLVVIYKVGKFGYDVSVDTLQMKKRDIYLAMKKIVEIYFSTNEPKRKTSEGNVCGGDPAIKKGGK